jgi:phosphatidate cytidylyltransferase
MHLKRLIIAFILLPLLYIYIMYLPSEYFLFLMVFFSTIALSEFYSMFRIKGLLKYTGILWGGALLFAFFVAREFFADILLLSVLTIMGLRLLIKREPAASLSETACVVFGLLYIPGLLSFQISLDRANPQWIVLLYTSVWASDSAAFYIGSAIGKRKLYKEISPNKTVAGATASIFGGTIGAVLIKFLFMHHIPLYIMIILGAAVGITTIIGDLVESMFKRDAGVKDSSNLVPGHGGVLDKLDSVTFAGPVFYWLCINLKLLQ